MKKIKVLIVDDHAIVREGLRALIAGQAGLDMVGEATSGEEALKMAAQLNPDVVVMDVSMPGMNGIEATRRLKAGQPHVQCVALSAHTDRRFVAEMLRAGACGYLPKECAFTELATAIRAAAEGKSYLSPNVTGGLVQDYVTLMPERVPRPHDALSAREREVLIQLAEGNSIKETAFALGVSTKTVDTLRRRTLTKLDCRTATDLTKYAIREGLITLE